MGIELLSDAEFLKLFSDAMVELDNEGFEVTFPVESGRSGKARASSIGGCVTQQYYDLSETPKTNDTDYKGIPFAHNLWSSWRGTEGEGLVRLIMETMGYTIMQPDVFGKCIVCGHPVQVEDECVLCDCTDHQSVISGHVDGILTGLDLGDEQVLWDSKIRNVFGYQKLVKHEFPNSDPTMWFQMQVYLSFLDLERCMVTVMPQDLSTTRNQFQRIYKLPTENVLVQRLWIEANQTAQDLALDRASGIMAAVVLGEVPVREHDPGDKRDSVFPCGFCPWLDQCINDHLTGKATFEIPPIPPEWKEA